ncbi:MAG: YqaJ viral recombinase family protein [Deltaproteobacteria bacterium]|nr:YqaJ viral recombinase family protein [Deltaproteobacteria bacterium]
MGAIQTIPRTATRVGHAGIIGWHDAMTHERWLELRKGGIGGSDAAAAVGKSDYRSRVYLWADKTDRIPPREQTEPMEWGHRHEATVLQKFAESHPELTVHRVGATLRHPDVPWALANLDGIALDENRRPVLVEVKTGGEYMKRKWAGGVPADYYWQTLHYLAVLGPMVQRAYVPVLLGGNHYEERIVNRDEDAIAWLLQQEREFWGYVQSGEMPPVDDTESTAEALALLWAESTPDIVRLPADALSLIAERESICDEQKALERRRTAVENQIKTMLGEHEKGSAGSHLVRWTTVQSERIDIKRLRAERPDLAAEYCATSSYRRFTVSEVK